MSHRTRRNRWRELALESQDLLAEALKLVAEVMRDQPTPEERVHLIFRRAAKSFLPPEKAPARRHNRAAIRGSGD